MHESQPARSVTIADGRMTVGGLPTAYVQDLARPVALAADGLRFVGGFASREGRLEDRRHIAAQARIVGGGLRRAGREGTATRLQLSLYPLQTAAEATRLLLMIGWREEEPEAPAFAEVFVPVALFEALKADLLAGLARELSLRASTSLWIREEDRERTQALPLDRYLAPEDDGAGSMPARGFVESLEWTSGPAPERAAPAQAEPEAAEPAPPPPPPAAEEIEDEAAEELRRINWSLRQLLLLIAFLLIILAIK